ncbi:D-aminopeptidase [Paenibacillus sp. yr247]|uniref:DmpA family aminopeptidase n=1 Tax=Paenibacillus sp. yr247 TaxID=1761880 RepID=UPI00088A9C5B|nr:P1 family peptidase [Paenibacillus sp. yr247]SDP15056.1 D-aminopeptidase [Paenibacillus sp. yr247]
MERMVLGVSKNRFREYGFTVGHLPTGKHNCITDVTGVTVGHVTLNTNDQDICIRTGVTAILPHQGNLFRQKVVAATHVINGFGKTSGLVQVNELGSIESPIMLTNTFSVPAVTEGTIQYMMELDAGIGDRDGSLNVVSGECNDKFLNDMRGLHVRPEHAIEAIGKAKLAQPVEEGSVGAGTGMVCFGWKGGIGTSSRMVEVDGQSYHFGVLVLTNFGVGEDLILLGHPVGRRLKEKAEAKTQERGNNDGSIIIVVGTDLPMDARQLQRVAKRAGFGLGRTGSIAHHGSGDIVIAFCNGNLIPHTPESNFIQIKVVREDGPTISECFRAVAEATEEAIYNSLFMAQTILGRNGKEVHALPVEEVVQMMRCMK